MKTLQGLEEVIRTFTGEPIRVTTEIEHCPQCGHQQQRDNQWTVGDALLHILSQSRITGKDAYLLYDVGRAIHQAEGCDISLEDHPFELLRREVDAFGGFTLAVMVPVRRTLDRAQRPVEANGSLVEV